MHRLICGFKLLGLLGWLGLSGHLAAQSPTITRSSGEVLPIRLELRTLGRGEKAPTVIVGHGSGGLAAMHREMGSTLNSWGYNAVVIDHYSLRGIAVHTGKVVLGARGEDRALDFIETGRWIAQQPWHEGKIAVVGFSQGGGGVLTLVNDRNMRNLDYVSDAQPNPISVASAFYPSCFFLRRRPSRPFLHRCIWPKWMIWPGSPTAAWATIRLTGSTSTRAPPIPSTRASRRLLDWVLPNDTTLGQRASPAKTSRSF